MSDNEMNDFNDKLKRIVYNLIKNMNGDEQFEFLYDWDFKNIEVEELGFKELLNDYEEKQ